MSMDLVDLVQGKLDLKEMMRRNLPMLEKVRQD